MHGRLLSSFLSLSLCLAAQCLARQRVLLFTAVADDGYRHPSIPDAVEAMRQLGKDNQVDMLHCDDRDEFADLDLTQFDALAFISAAGSVLTNKGAAKMRRYITNGGGYVGVHEASCAATKVPWYLRLVGAQFSYHPEITRATMDVLDRHHPSTKHLNETWEVYDEIYNYQSDPRDLGATILLGADESTYWDKIQPQSERAKVQGSPHPIAWYREGNLLTAPAHHTLGGGLDNTRAAIQKGIAGSGGAGRSWYTGLGHTHACWQKDDFLQHVWGGVAWVLDSPSIASNNASSADAPGQKFNGTTSQRTSASTKQTNSSGTVPSPSPSANGTSLHSTSGGTALIVPSAALSLLPAIALWAICLATVL